MSGWAARTKLGDVRVPALAAMGPSEAEVDAAVEQERPVRERARSIASAAQREVGVRLDVDLEEHERDGDAGAEAQVEGLRRSGAAGRENALNRLDRLVVLVNVDGDGPAHVEGEDGRAHPHAGPQDGADAAAVRAG